MVVRGVNRHIELISIKKAQIKEAKIEGNFAFIQVDFLSEQINFTYNDNDELLEGQELKQLRLKIFGCLKRIVIQKSKLDHFLYEDD